MQAIEVFRCYFCRISPSTWLTAISLCEARGIKGVEKNGNSDGMVELWVGKEKKNHLQTKHFDDSVTPQARLMSIFVDHFTPFGSYSLPVAA